MIRLFFLLSVTGIFVVSVAQAQQNKPYTKQLSLTWDNDYFVFKGTDRYYTNGIFIGYDKLDKKQNPKLVKRITGFEIGQTIYKQFTRKVWPTVLLSNYYPGGVGAIDRPITGYLYAKIKRKLFYKNEQQLQVAASIGTIGPNSLGREVQTDWHNASGVGDWWNWVWDYQLKSELGINIHGQYLLPFNKMKRKRNHWNITSVTNTTLGTTFTDVSQGFLFQLGKINATSESSYWGANVNAATISKKELFFYYLPEVKYQVYNATVQGGMFRDDKGPITSGIEPFVFTHNIGLQYAGEKYSANVAVVYMSKEANTQRNTHAFGKISLSRRFH